MRVIAHYRTRPSEPVASAQALAAQVAAVEHYCRSDKVTLIATFTDVENPSGTSDWPEYVKAARLAMSPGKGDYANALLVIPSHDGIGSGPRFEPPHIPGEPIPFVTMELEASLEAPPTLIPLPDGAPASISLFASAKPNQASTHIYLANSELFSVTDITVSIDNISLDQHSRLPRDTKWEVVDYTHRQTHADLPPGHGLLLLSRGDILWDFVNRFRVAYSDKNNQRHTVEAVDIWLYANGLSFDIDGPQWAPFRTLKQSDPKSENGEDHDKS